MDAIHQAQRDGVVIGLKGISTQPVPRLDIEDFLLNKPDTFNLYLLAISELQEDGYVKEKMAWQQVAGIHGLPLTLWDGVKGPGKPAGMGYCAHGRPTFPTWHRPYLAMMEQTVFTKMADIADRYPTQFKSKYQAALKDFRLPYWDYYRPRLGRITHSAEMPGIVSNGGTTTSFPYDFPVPQVFVLEQIMVRRYDQNDELHPMPNPLCTFHFPDPNIGGLTDKDWAFATEVNRVQTVRYPLSMEDFKGSYDDQSQMINRERESNLKAILAMIRDYKSYGTFSSSSATQGESGNLEGIHNAYHMLIGGRFDPTTRPGHMSLTETAAFDPIFWMHHCLIDRWLAIWQSANPDVWYDGEFIDGIHGRTPIPPWAHKDALPFRKPDGGFWNGDLSRYTETFGYFYTDAVKDSPQQIKDNFNYLYNWQVRRDLRQSIGKPPPEMTPLPWQDAQAFQYTAAPIASNVAARLAAEGPQKFLKTAKKAVTAVVGAVGASASVSETTDSSTQPIDAAPVPPATGSSSTAFTNLTPADAKAPESDIDESQYYREWYIDHIVERLALNGSFAIFYFLGPFSDENVANYAYEPTMAGLNYVFAADPRACDNCGVQDADHFKVINTKIITPMLMDYVKLTLEDEENQRDPRTVLRDLKPESVVPFLIANLKWRIVDSAGVRQNPRNVAGFKLGVSASLTPHESNDPPIYQEYPQIIEQIISASS